jgi:hypothetical protein
MWTGRHGSYDGVPAASLLSSSSAHAEAERSFPEGDIAPGSANLMELPWWCSAPLRSTHCPSYPRVKP